MDTNFGGKWNKGDDHFGELTIYPTIDAICFIVSIISIITNVLLLYITCIKRKFNFAIDSIMISFIGGFDLVAGIFMFISLIFKWATNNEYTVNESVWCRISSILFGATTIATISLVALFSLLRYLVIVKGYRIHTFVALIISVLLIIITWSVFLERTLQSNRLRVNPSGLYCLPQMWGRDASDRVLPFFILILTVPSLVFIPLFNLLVATHYGNIVREMGRETKIPGYSKLRSNVFKLIVVIFAYAVTTLPEFFSIVLNLGVKGAKRLAIVDGIVITLLFSVIIVNSLFTLLLHDDTKRELYEIFGVGVSHFESFKMDKTDRADSGSEIC